jgi:hypothetical protein
MANQRVILEFSLQDVNSSIKGANKDAQALRGTLESIQKISTKTGSKAKAAAFGGVMGSDSYDVARGSAGATGASGRDFANQARGLDGLVRLYATYAANLFAAGAAFRALSNAADTSNMIKGMDQLGASSGQALGTIAKRLVDSTDGAISFREAIEATTKGTAAGLSSKQMQQLGEVANKASKALGVAMPDAISRLTRGISKLEPELLDELGLFTKIEPAVQAYARTLGKTAGTLSDFERRQAFAVAVLKEGLDKFGEIDISANPYDRLLASLQNLGQGALEIVNKVLGPLVNVLSQSPGALLAVLTAIGVSILRTAIPAIGQYRERLKGAAEESRLAFTQIYKDQQIALSDLAIGAGAQAEATYRNTAGVRSKIADLEKEAKTFSKGKKDFSALAGKDPFALTSAEIKSLENRARYLQGRNDAEAAALKAHVTKIKALRAEGLAANELASTKVEKGSEGILTTAGANDVIYKRKLTQASMDAIRVNVAETQSVYGMRAAFKKLGEELNLARAGMLKVETGTDATGKKIIETAPKLGALGTAYTAVSSTVGILGQKIGKTVEALSPWLVGIAVAVEVIGLLDSALTKTAKQQAVFDKALESNKDAVDNVTRTIDVLNKKEPYAVGTISGINALSNAMNELTSSTEGTIYASSKLKDAIGNSLYDELKNKILGIFNKDVDSELAKSLTESLQSSLRLLSKSGLQDEGAKAFKEALGIQSLDVDSVNKAFLKGGDAIEKFQKAQTKLNANMGTANSNLQSFKTATEASTKAYQEFIQSTANNNPLFKLGASLEDVGNSMQKVFKGGIRDINAALNDLIDNPEKVANFGQNFVNQFVKIRGEFKSNIENYANYTKAIEQLDLQSAEKRLRIEELRKRGGRQGGRNDQAIRALQEDLVNIDESRRKASAALPDIGTFDRAKQLFIEGADGAFQRGAELIKTALGQAQERAALTIAKAMAGGLTGEQAAIEQGRIKQRELQIQLNAINTNIDLIKSQELLRASIDESTALTAFNTAKPEEKSQAAEIYGAAVIFKRALEESKGRGSVNIPLQNDGSLKEATLKLKMGTVNRQIASQQANATGVIGEMAGGKIETGRAARAGQLSDLQKLDAAQDSVRQQELARLSITNSITNAMTQQDLVAQSLNENATLEARQRLEILTIDNAILDAYDTKNLKELAKQKELKGILLDRQDLETKNKGLQDQLKVVDLRFAKEKLSRDIESQAQENAIKMTSAQLGAEQELFNARSSLGIVYGEQAEYQRKSLEYSTLNNSIAQSELALQKDKANVLAEIQSRIDKLATAGKDTSEIEKEKTAALANFASQKSALDITNQGRKTALDLTQSFTDRQLAYGEVFKNSFAEMGNALIEFTKTGKLNFKGLVDSMIEGLIRYELQQQSLAMYAAARPALMNLVGSVFGFGVGPITANAFRAQDLAGGSVMGASMARGGVYDAGLQKFGKGGMFTNSIVASPTMFKFAKGTGLMGEAGPEAIMPLKRDGQGNLGVRVGGGGGSVDVVVNNYGNERATTKETTDSRGNRKIEVVIGDMVASEVARPGSSVQQSLANGFNNRPALARR